MKLLIQNSHIIGTATDAYTGPDEFVTAPDDFDVAKMSDYVIVDGLVTLPVKVPQVLTIRQARRVLLAHNLLDTVEAAVAQADRATQIDWEFATEVKRDWPALAAITAALGMTPEQLDALFVEGAAL